MATFYVPSLQGSGSVISGYIAVLFHLRTFLHLIIYRFNNQTSKAYYSH